MAVEPTACGARGRDDGFASMTGSSKGRGRKAETVGMVGCCRTLAGCLEGRGERKREREERSVIRAVGRTVKPAAARVQAAAQRCSATASGAQCRSAARCNTHGMAMAQPQVLFTLRRYGCI